MKHILLISIAVIFALTMAINVNAQDNKADTEDSDASIAVSEIQYDNSPMNKLGRGAVNTATCWAEIPAQVCRVSKDKDPFLGATLGLLEGGVTTIIRGVTGIIDFVTFFAPPYDKPLMEPEYALKSADDEFKEYLW